MTTKQFLLKLFLVKLLLLFICSNSIGQVNPPPPPPPKPNVEEIFEVVEDFPLFPGCEERTDNKTRKECAEKKMLEYIYSNLEYPAIAKENGIEGTCVVSFYVDKDGTIQEPRLLKDIGAGCGQEALRLVKNFGGENTRSWVPGKARANPVKVYFNLPIKFRLDQSQSAKNNKDALELDAIPADRQMDSVRSSQPAPPPPPPPPPPRPKVPEFFEVVEKMPVLIGCSQYADQAAREKCTDEKILSYVNSQLKYPPIARENSIEGICVIRFYMDTDGSIKGAKINEDIGAGCGQEALRVVKNMSNESSIRFVPGKSRNQPVKLFFILPVRFKLSENQSSRNEVEALGLELIKMNRVITPSPPPPPPKPNFPPPTKSQKLKEHSRFPGCEDISDRVERNNCANEKMTTFIYSNLKYPPKARRKRVEGTCVIRFYVDLDGSIKGAKILKDIGAGCGQEALRIVNSMNDMQEKWIPPGNSRNILKHYLDLHIKFDIKQKSKSENILMMVNIIERSFNKRPIKNFKLIPKDKTDNKIILSLEVPVGSSNITIQNEFEKVILSEVLQKPQTSFYYEMNVNDLPTGVYKIIVSQETETHEKLFLIYN